MNNVSKTYGRGKSTVEALHSVNFEANHGQLVGIVGPSGSGKSTFLSIAGGLQEASSGETLIEGKVLRDLSHSQAEQLRLNSIGFVLQSYNLVPFLTIKQQFTLVEKVKKHDNMPQHKFEEVLSLLGVDELLNSYPENLSGGQRQRVAIARALYANPAIVLADEPTASLDTDRAMQTMELFSNLAHSMNKAIIVVTHDTRLEQYTDELYNITDGSIQHVTAK